MPPNYSQHVSTRTTPQKEKARPDQVENNAGGYVFAIDCWKQLDRFLILGNEGGSYYATERQMTKENAGCVMKCLHEDGLRTVARIVEISDAGRAPKNDPAIFALAMAASDAKPQTRYAALAALPQVCRIGTHLFHFVRDIKSFRRWSRMLRTAVAKWYTHKPVERLAFDLLKYQQRDGWGHRDVIRLSHPAPNSGEWHMAKQACLRWAVGADFGDRDVKRGKGKDAPTTRYMGNVHEALPPMLAAYEELKKSDVKRCIELIAEHGFTHEMIPTQHKNSVDVWEALLQKMPQTAMIRNLGKMTQVGLLTAMGQHTRKVAQMLTDKDRLTKARVHPISLLSALKIYQQGHGEKGKLTWDAQREIVDALDEAFYASFQTVEPTGKRILLALDVSGSMRDGAIAGCPGLTPRVASAAMAMVTARTENNWHCIGYTSSGGSYYSGRGFGVTPIDISPRQRLDDVIQLIERLPMGGTDCALPFIYASEKKMEVDGVFSYTDNETHSGTIHVFQAVRDYRAKFVPNAKLVAVGMTATKYSIADPNDAGMMDVTGFDSAAPAIMSDFLRE